MRTNHTTRFPISLATAVLALSGSHLRAEEPQNSGNAESYDLAMQLVNPVASLISLPLQNNFDWGGGPDGDGFQYRINIQPVIPFDLNEHWNLISRTILPYTKGMHTTFSLNVESSYDWENSQWTVPVNLGVSQLLKIGGSPVQFQLGGRYYAETPDNGPEWGLRFTITFLWPR